MVKAIRLRQPASLDNLYADKIASQSPGRGEVRVRIQAASLNFRDCLVVAGYFPARDGLIPLSDGAGEVLEVGDDVTDFAPGDKVVSCFHPGWFDGHLERTQLRRSPGAMADGFACEEVTRPFWHFTKAPRSWTAAESATLTCAGVTAWRALVTDGQVKPGAVVLIQGTGGVSLAALQIAKAAGATVIATSSSAEKIARLKALGADHTINYNEVEHWGETVQDLTGGLGVDHVIEVAGPNTLPQSMVAARTGGHIAIIGGAGGFENDVMPFAIVQAKRLRLHGVTVGSRRDQLDMVRAFDHHPELRPVIDCTFPLDDLAEALHYQQEESGRVGKVCIAI